MKGLPTGLKYSSKTGLVSGYAKKAGLFQVKVTATAKGAEAAETAFTIAVRAMPVSLLGNYVGVVSNAIDGEVLASATVTSAGKVSVKLRHLGMNRTFSCSGFNSAADGDVFLASPRQSVKGVASVLPLRIASREISIDGYSGLLMQNPWGRKDIAAPAFSGRVKTDAAGFAFAFYGKGKAKVTGTLGGKKVSGTFQTVVGGNGQYALPVAFAPKKNLSGWSGTFAVKFGLDSKGKVSSAAVYPQETLE